jgi:tight adherence protein B
VRRVRVGVSFVALAVAGCCAAIAAGATSAAPQLAPIGRVPFPERGYVVDLPANTAIDTASVHVTENGRPVQDFAFTPLKTSGLRSAVVLAIDTSESMTGAPAAAAVVAARAFVAHRGPNQEVGVVTFNGQVRVRLPLTTSTRALKATLATQPALAQGTHIFDAIERSLTLLKQANAQTAAIVVLSDGADVGSNVTLDKAVARATRQKVRVFTVGLRSRAFDSETLATIASETGASYAEAASTTQLAPIFSALSERLASEYVLQYRSGATPHSHVDVRVDIDGMGAVTSSYTAPTPSKLPPFHRSLVSRFLLSGGSLVLLALLVAGIIGYAISGVLETRRTRLVERVNAFGINPSDTSPVEAKRRRWGARTSRAAAASSHHATRMMRDLARDLDIAGIEHSPAAVAWTTAGATVLLALVLSTIAPILFLLALMTPFFVRGYIRRRVKRVRDEFDAQLPPNLQMLASALRAGHSFAGALAMTAENAEEPSRRELRRAISDAQLGVPIDEALRRIADRLANRDLEQVALVAELQRTTGGNVAEVLDTVVSTIRDRADVRRLARTLTAQGRLARWILVGLPIATGFGLYAIQPDLMRAMLSSSAGQVLLVIAAILVVAGSLVIQRIIEIEV